jgi:hypothetical protein
MGLQTILWKYDSNDWRVGQNGYTAANVDASYQFFIANLTAGSFDTVGGIMLTHELNNYTMQEAVNWYPQLKAAFSVRCCRCFHTQTGSHSLFFFSLSFFSLHHPSPHVTTTSTSSPSALP